VIKGERRERYCPRLMSEDNVELVRRAWDAWLGGDAEEALAYADADFVVKRVAPMPDPTPYHGPEGLVQILADWVEGFDEFEMRPEEYIDAGGEQVVLRLHQAAVGAVSRVPIEADFWFVHTLRNGKIVGLDIYGSESQALQAVGMSD
jgi:ketosteroid isomerase-like protein